MRPFALTCVVAFLLGCTSLDVIGKRATEAEGRMTPLPNLLEQRQNVPLSEVNAQLNDAFLQLFFGDPETQAVFVDRRDGTGYIEDIANHDVRTDSMAYGLLATVQLDQRETFDKLWAWTKTYMMVHDGPSEGVLSWECGTNGDDCDDEAATDSSSIIATSLFMAQERWGTSGTHNYAKDALALLEVMVDIEGRNGGKVKVTKMVDGVEKERYIVNCFDLEAALPRHGSQNEATDVPVDYLMPAFYEIWAKHDRSHAEFWRRAATASRALLARIANPTTGLYPEVVNYQGVPIHGYDTYGSMTSRTLLNLTLDHLWFGPHVWIVENNERLLDFFLQEGVSNYVSRYSVDGERLVDFNTIAHRALVALAAGTSPNAKYDPFIEDILLEQTPMGKYRYYDGMLYMLSLMVLSGQMTPN